MKFDAHNHAIPKECIQWLRRKSRIFRVTIEDGEPPYLRHGAGYRYPLHTSFCDVPSKLERMAAKGFDSALISLAPPLLFYEVVIDEARRFARVANSSLADMARQYPERLRFAATLPLQNVDAAMEELGNARALPGLAAVMIGTSVNGVPLDDARFSVLWQTCVKYELPVMLHPSYVGYRDELADYYMTNVVGNPMETTVAAMRLGSSGVLEQHPELKVILVHGGGCLPYLMGRVAHARKVRPELEDAPNELGSYQRRFFYDSLVYTPEVLRFLIDFVGPDRILAGTDDPFDMAEDDPQGLLREATSGDLGILSMILDGTPSRLFKIG
jgi:aminocarboxymuconate-semialdehyde decarboxylase